MPSVFTRIIDRELPCYKIYEDDLVIVFLDITPFAKGHTLIVPKIEVDEFYDIEEPHYSACFLAVKKISLAMKKAFPVVQRIGMLAEGFQVPHAHIHLIPFFTGKELQTWERQDFSKEEMTEIAEKIASHLE